MILDLETDAIAQPYRILVQGEWVDTGCVAWPLPKESDWKYDPLTEYNQLMERFLLIYMGSDLETEVAKILSEQKDIQYNEFSQRFEELLEGSEIGPELAEIRAEMDKFVSPDDVTMLYGIPVFSVDDFIPKDPYRGVNRILWEARELLKDEPVIAYRALSGTWMGIDVSVTGLLVIAPVTDQYDILRIEQTNAANYGSGTEDIIAKLKELDTEFGIDIIGAGFDAVEFLLEQIPEGKKARELGDWLLEFCPDLYEAPARFEGPTALWWD
jgi:hypothetical protein